MKVLRKPGALPPQAEGYWPDEIVSAGPPPWRVRWRLLFPVHAFWNSLFGLRGRLRCPHCGATGTWAPHGGFWDRVRSGDRPVRRWLCKWCGYYNGPEGELFGFPDKERGVWSLPRPYYPEAPEEPGPTPADAFASVMGRTWPWTYKRRAG